MSMACCHKCGIPEVQHLLSDHGFIAEKQQQQQPLRPMAAEANKGTQVSHIVIHDLHRHVLLSNRKTLTLARIKDVKQKKYMQLVN